MLNNKLGPLILDLESVEIQQDEAEIIQHPQVGGLILFSRNFESSEQLIGLTRRIREVRSDIVISVDHEGGRVQRFQTDFTRLPPMQTFHKLYKTSNLQKACDHARETAWLMAVELLAHDVDLSYAPVLDLDESHSDIIGDRAFSDDSDICTALAEAFIDGMNDAGMASTGKHFPGHGGVKADSHLELPVDQRLLSDLESHDLKPFIELKDKLAALMSAHILFPNIDDELVSFSRVWLDKILREKIGFKGVVFSDDLTMEGAAGGGSFSDRALKALHAGCDVLLVCNHRSGAIEVLEALEKLPALQDRRCLSALAKRRPWDWEDLTSSVRWKKAVGLVTELYA